MQLAEKPGARRGVSRRRQRERPGVKRAAATGGRGAEHGGFMSYHSGVMGGKCGDAVDHSVLVVGCGDDVFPPPPGSTIQCGQPQQFCGCHDVSGKAVLPIPAGATTELSLENCAAQCVALNLTVAGIDAGNHCNCGDLAALAAGAGRPSRVPAEQLHRHQRGRVSAATPRASAPATKCAAVRRACSRTMPVQLHHDAAHHSRRRRRRPASSPAGSQRRAWGARHDERPDAAWRRRWQGRSTPSASRGHYP